MAIEAAQLINPGRWTKLRENRPRRSGPVQALLRRPDIQLASKVQMERMRRVHRVYVAGDGSEDLI